MKKLFSITLISALAIGGHTQCITNITDSLLVKWDFSGNAFDASGNAHHGSVSGVVATADRCGADNAAYSFSGTDVDQYIDVTNTEDLELSNTDFAISVWTYQDAEATFNNTIISKRNGYGLQNGYWLGIGANQVLEFAVAGGDPGSSFIDSAFPLCPQTWNHIVVNYNNDAQTMEMYINSVLETTATVISPTATSADLRIGNDIMGNPYQFNGKIDDLQMYNRMLNDCSIDSLYHSMCITEFIPCETSISDVIQPYSIHIFPNPVNDHLQVVLSDFPRGNVSLTLSHLLGEVVLQTNLTSVNSVVEIDQPEGVYLLTIENGSEVRTERVVVQR